MWWQSSEYALGWNYGRVLNIQKFWVCQISANASIAQGSEYAWIWLYNALWQGSEYGWRFHMILKNPPVLNMQWARNMASLWICEGYTRCWICQNKSEYALIMSQYVWICLSNRKARESGRFVELGHFHKEFVKKKKTEKEALQGNILEFFLLDTLKTTFWMENLTQRWTQSGPFFQKPGHFFQFFKRAGEASPLPVVACLWVWLNIYQYPWICLNILENAWINCSMLGIWICMISYIFDRLLKMPQALNKPGFSIWHGCICKGYADFQICLILAPYASIMP